MWFQQDCIKDGVVKMGVYYFHILTLLIQDPDIFYSVMLQRFWIVIKSNIISADLNCMTVYLIIFNAICQIFQASF